MTLTAWLPVEDESEGDDPFLVQLQRELDDDVVELLPASSVPATATPTVLVRGVPEESMLAACPRLTHLLIPYAGLPRATRERLQARPEVAVHNLHHNAAPTAELAVALLLACAKEVVPHDRDLRRGDWRRRYAEATTTTLAGGHALVLGYGAIGQRVAHALGALGMRVTAVRRSARGGDRHGMVALVPPRALATELSRADAVVICLPWTEETDGLLDAAMLRCLPASAYLVNVGRGAIVDEDALYAALAEGRLAGAGLDVWYRYPSTVAERASTPPSAHPFGSLDNVVLSPHRGGKTRQNEVARARGVARMLEAIAAGGEVPNRVDLDAGY